MLISPRSLINPLVNPRIQVDFRLQCCKCVISLYVCAMHANRNLGWALNCMVRVSSAGVSFSLGTTHLGSQLISMFTWIIYKAKTAQLNSFRTTLAALLNTKALEEIHYFGRITACFPFSRPETTSSLSVPFMMHLMANTCWRNTFPIHYITLSCIMVWYLWHCHSVFNQHVFCCVLFLFSLTD